MAQKQEIISSIFPEKLQFDGKKCRTPRINDALRYILQINKNSEEKNKGQILNSLQSDLKKLIR